MKNARKLTSILLLIAMLFMIAAPAMAAGEDGYTITINNATEGHTYEAYQIFAGDLSTKTVGEGENAKVEKVLSNIVWGTGVKDTVKAQDAVEKAESLKNTADAEAFAESLKDQLQNPATSTYNADSKVYTISGLAAGYYLIKDKDTSLTGKDDAYTAFILKVVGDASATPKSEKPSSEKKVKDINDSTGTAYTDWQDSADYDIGDTVQFQLKATLPKNFDAYDTYKLIFHDTMSKGLTYNATPAAVVNVNGEKVGEITATTNPYNNSEDENDKYNGGNTLTFTIDNVKTFAPGAKNGDVITIEYTATLNESANFGSAGNPNKMHIEYSNNPNGEGTGKTQDDTVIVFTYKALINKVQPNPNFNKDEQVSETNPQYIDLSGADFTLFKFVVGEGSDEYKNLTGQWKEVTRKTVTDGVKFTFTGLDDGYYKLSETTTPDGYNTIADIEFTITAEHDVLSNDPSLTSLYGNVTSGEATFTPAGDNSSLSTDILNQTGTQLPETGGIGTTIFYVVGAALVVGAGVLLVTKKRMTGQR